MLEFLKQTTLLCSLCQGNIVSENCSPHGCTHPFHLECLENWCSPSDESPDQHKCPVSSCRVTFTEVTLRDLPNGTPTGVKSFKAAPACPICCENLQPPFATPESCNHTFCYICIREWSRVRHECPFCRGKFELILLSDRIDGPITNRVSPPPVEGQSFDDAGELEMDINCEVCSQSNHEELLLLCDQCDRGYHTFCLSVPLESVPTGDWFCPHCEQEEASQEVTASPNSSFGLRHHRNRRSNRSNTRRNHRAQQLRRLENLDLVDFEAEETDRSGSDESPDEVDTSIDSPRHHRLSGTLQRILRRRALQRHRGSRVLQDTIQSLTERVLSEVSARERHRRNRQVNGSIALAGRHRQRTNEPSQQTLNFGASNPNGRLELRVGEPTNVTSRSSRSNSQSTGAERSGRTQSQRRRVVFESDSDTSLHNDLTSPQSSAPVTRSDRAGRKRLLSGRESSDHDATIPSPLASPSEERRRKRKRVHRTSTSAEEEEEEEDCDDDEESDEDDDEEEESEEEEEESEESDTDDDEEEIDQLPITPQPSTSRVAVPRPRARPRRKTSKKRKSKTKRRTVKRKPSKTSKTKGKKRKLTKPQKRLKRRLSQTSKTSSASTTTVSPTPVSRSTHRSPGKSSARFSLLSVFGSELGASQVVEDSEHESSSRKTSSTTTSISTTPTTNGFRSTKSNLLSEIEANQKSLFAFTTRHMEVTSDHSMRPIPVPIEEAKTSYTNRPTASSSSSSAVASGQSRAVPLPGPQFRLPLKPSVARPSPSTSHSNNEMPKTSASNGKENLTNNNQSKSQNCVVKSESCAPTRDQSSSQTNQNGWIPERVAHVKSVLKANLRPHLHTGVIDKVTYTSILERALFKAHKKSPDRVNDARLVKLIEEYVDYFRRFPNSSQS